MNMEIIVEDPSGASASDGPTLPRVEASRNAPLGTIPGRSAPPAIGVDGAVTGDTSRTNAAGGAVPGPSTDSLLGGRISDSPELAWPSYRESAAFTAARRSE